MAHTRYFSGKGEAEEAFAAMKAELDRIIGLLDDGGSEPDEARRTVLQAIGAFVERFPT
jgi:hypothetical protein